MWIFSALNASIFWGLTYVLNEQVYKKISFFTSIASTCLLTSIVMFFVAGLKGELRRDVITIGSSINFLILFLLSILAFILAEIAIAVSITSKNATLAGLIEISYPIFIAMFSYVLFGEKAINISTAIGATLIFTGVVIIYHFNR